MKEFVLTAGLVALAEVGDKTQLLTFTLITRFPRSGWPIFWGILIATLMNHGLTGVTAGGVEYLGSLVVGKDQFETWMRYLVAASCLAFAVWVLIPDKKEGMGTAGPYGVFLATVWAFFFVEIGDKTEVATFALAIEFARIAIVVAGSTFGMLLANVPVILIGEWVSQKVPVQAVRRVAAVLFVATGIGVFFGWLRG
jgi:putative Ca2+/H+ antiporter (TMEM165/GDT1 family)